MNTREYLIALAYAAGAHEGQLRKGTRIPYVIHPIAVSTLVLEYGGSETQAIAALLHDVPEDTGGAKRLQEIARRFGEPVAHIVALCTDSLAESKGGKDEWRKRKEAHIAKLREHLTPEAALVLAADKLHNLRAIRRDLRVRGNDLWTMFQGGQVGTLWYYAEMVSVLSGIDSEHENVWRITQELESLFDDLDQATGNVVYF